MLMLGTPNGGSWAPMQVLSGDDTFGNTLVAFGAPFQDASARELMAQLPGFIQLQAGLLDTTLGLDRHETWQKLADDGSARAAGAQLVAPPARSSSNAYGWGVPPQDVLDRPWRCAEGSTRSATICASVQGQAAARRRQGARSRPTATRSATMAWSISTRRSTATAASRCESALLPGVRTWQFDCDHGGAASRREAFEAYLELLETGTPTALEPLIRGGDPRGAASRAAATSEPALARARCPARPPEVERDVFARRRGRRRDGRRPPARRCASRSSTATDASSGSR